MAKETLNQAKINKNDEFYTRLEDIAAELCNYKKHFEGKIVFCNCDDPEWSNFWIYFHQNFSELKLKKLISTHYNKDGSPSYKMEYSGGNDADVRDWKQTQLKGDGDFRSEECVNILQEADIVVTNPPFSLFKEYIQQLIDYKKSFVILGNPNAITYKDFFPKLQNNELWIGYKSMGSDMYFIVSDEHAEDLKKTKKEGSGYVIIDEKIYGRAQAIWYTNLDIPKRHASLVDELKYQFAKHPDWYPKYDNYDAINIGYVGTDLKLQKKTNKVDYIPYDYFGVMGVPITFMDKYNPDEFEIVGLAPERAGKSSVLRCKKYQKAIQHNDPKKVEAGKKNETENGIKVNDGPVIILDEKPAKYPYYTCPTEPGKYLTVLYARILIKRKKQKGDDNDN